MMRSKMYFILITLIYLHLISGKNIDESCQQENEIFVMCKCIGNEEFFLPSNFNYGNLTELEISSCVSANLHFYSLPNAISIRNITIQNISENLLFDPMLSSPKMGIFEIKNVGKIPIVGHDTFISIISIDFFRIENTKIDNFDEQFSHIKIENLIFRNVTINKMSGINFSGKAQSLKIIDSVILNIAGNFNFAQFSSIELINSTFEFKKSGEMSIEGEIAKINNCTFYNVSVNVVTRKNIQMTNNCADGSSLRLDSEIIYSQGNKFPTEITYKENRAIPLPYRINNNTVCIAGNCKCPKSFDRNSHGNLNVNIILGFILMFVLYLI